MQVPKKIDSSGTFTFNRWSRKGYAIFRSLGAQVKIAGLALAVSSVMMPKESNAQQQDTAEVSKLIEMDEVVVSAQRTEVIYSQMARMVEVLDAEEIAQMPVQTIDELLEYAMNADIRQRGGMNVQADVSIRAGSFDQVMILLNGVNITDPQTGHHNLNLPVDLSAVKRIEILSGPGSRIFGPNAFSGAINIITGSKYDKAVKAGLHAGEHGYARATASAKLKKGKISHFVAADYGRSDGYRENTDFGMGSAFYQMKWNSSTNNTLDVQAGYNQKQFGANSFYTPAYPEQFEETRTAFASIRYRMDAKLKTEIKTYWRRHHDRFELFRNEAPDWYSGHNYHLTNVAGASINTTIPVKYGKLALGAEYRIEHIYSNVLGEPLNDSLKAPGEEHGYFFKSARRDNMSAFVEYAVKLEKLYLATGVMANYNPEISSKLKFFPGLDLNYEISRKLQAFATGSYGMRLPTFTDLYYQGPTNLGNKDLKPEESASSEFGLKFYSKHFMLRASGFRRWGTNIIDWVKLDAQDKWQTMNLTSLNTSGFSLQAKTDLRKITGMQFFNQAEINYSYAYQEKESGEYISRYALDYLRHKVSIRMKHSIMEGFDLSWNASFQDRAGGFILYENGSYGEEVNYKPFSLLDIRLQYRISEWGFYAEAINVLNKEYYDLGNLPQPGRWFRAGISWQLNAF